MHGLFMVMSYGSLRDESRMYDHDRRMQGQG